MSRFEGRPRVGQIGHRVGQIGHRVGQHPRSPASGRSILSDLSNLCPTRFEVRSDTLNDSLPGGRGWLSNLSDLISINKFILQKGADDGGMRVMMRVETTNKVRVGQVGQKGAIR